MTANIINNININNNKVNDIKDNNTIKDNNFVKKDNSIKNKSFKKKASIKSKSKKKNVQLIFKSSDAQFLNDAIAKCRNVILNTGGLCVSIVRLPNRNRYNLISINRSPHVYNTHKDQFKLKLLKAIMWIMPKDLTFSTLGDLVIGGGVNVEMVILNNEDTKNE